MNPETTQLRRNDLRAMLLDPDENRKVYIAKRYVDLGQVPSFTIFEFMAEKPRTSRRAFSLCTLDSALHLVGESPDTDGFQPRIPIATTDNEIFIGYIRGRT